MLLYDYLCSNKTCEFLWENVQQSINSQQKKKCPKCGRNSLDRVITGGLCSFIRQDASTLGQLAERNSKKMGKYGVGDADGLKNEKISKGLKQRQEENKAIGKMTDRQKQKFIGGR